MGGGPTAAPQAPFATREAARRNPVTLYSSSNCGDLCNQGRALLAKRGVPFTEKQADVDVAAGDKVKELTGKLQVPVLVVGERHVQGFAADLWSAALDSAGYAKTALPGQVNPEAAAPPPAPPAPPANPQPAPETQPENPAAEPPATK
jgi:glutaredoxin